MDFRGQLSRPEDALAFFLAGNATITLVSEVTGVRYTYKMKKPEEQRSPSGPIYFVSVMYGSDNEGDFSYMGLITDRGPYRRTKNSKVSPGDVRERGFQYAWDHIRAGRMPPKCEVWHEGRCCRCGRKLTVPESVARGIGPECAVRMAEAA